MYVCVKLGSQVDKASALQSEDVGSIPVYYRFANPFSKEFNFENADYSQCLYLIWTLGRVSEIV